MLLSPLSWIMRDHAFNNSKDDFMMTKQKYEMPIIFANIYFPQKIHHVITNKNHYYKKITAHNI